MILKTSGPLDWACRIPSFITILVMESHSMFELWPVFCLIHCTTTHSRLSTSTEHAPRGDFKDSSIPKGRSRINGKVKTGSSVVREDLF